MKLISTTLLALAGLSNLSICASAADITWTLQDTYLYQGGDEPCTNISGSFVYDADTNAYSDISITSEYGGVGVLGTVDEPELGAAPPSPLGFYAYSVCCLVEFSFASPLTDAGGTVDIADDALYFYIGSSWSEEAANPVFGDNLIGAVVAQGSSGTTPERASLLFGISGIIAFRALAIRRRWV